jgi:glyoxylase-like metal-dependent hydrolase (beta-lactamase superfamily II)
MSWQLSIIEVGVIPDIPLTVYLPDAPVGALISPPCYCYLATDGSTIVLIDSGPDHVRAGAAGLQIDGDSPALLTAGLEAAGITAADVDLIVHTHLHYDHMQNDLLFPDAPVVVQRTELDWATSPGSGPFYVDVGELTGALGERLRLLDGETEILPGLTALPNGGHTPGHQSVLVRTGSGDACVCGDIVSLEENLEVIGAVCPDREGAETFLARARKAGWQMLPSHDARLRQHVWYLRVGAPRSERHLSVEPPENGRQA